MTGEVIIQLPENVSMLSYDRRSHHPPNSPVICQYRHNLGSWMMTSLVIWQYRDSIPVAGWWLLLSYVSIETGEVIIQLPRSCLFWHMTGEVIIHYPIMSLCCYMTGEVIIQLEIININVRNFKFPIGFYSNPHQVSWNSVLLFLRSAVDKFMQ
jgi:hypothetical protein